MKVFSVVSFVICDSWLVNNSVEKKKMGTKCARKCSATFDPINACNFRLFTQKWNIRSNSKCIFRIFGFDRLWPYACTGYFATNIFVSFIHFIFCCSVGCYVCVAPTLRPNGIYFTNCVNTVFRFIAGTCGVTLFTLFTVYDAFAIHIPIS